MRNYIVAMALAAVALAGCKAVDPIAAANAAEHPADAATSMCQQWAFAMRASVYGLADGPLLDEATVSYLAPEGWEPYAFSGQPQQILFRKCVK